MRDVRTDNVTEEQGYDIDEAYRQLDDDELAASFCRDCEHEHGAHDEYGACLETGCGCMGWK